MHPALERFAFGRAEPVVVQRTRVWSGLMVLGRAMIATVFVWMGIDKVMTWGAYVSYMNAEGMRAIPFFLAAAIVIEIVGGLMIFTGTFTRFAAVGLCLYLIPVTLIFHDFWNEGGLARQYDLFHFLKNVAIMGGLLAVTSLGPSRYTLDNQIRRRRVEGLPAERGPVVTERVAAPEPPLLGSPGQQAGYQREAEPPPPGVIPPRSPEDPDR
jgi:putative oxidoreductase